MVGEATIAVARIPEAFVVAPFPFDTGGELSRERSAAASVKFRAAGTSAFAGQDFGQVISEPTNLTVVAPRFRGSNPKTENGSSMLQVVDAVVTFPSTDDHTCPSVRLNDGVGYRLNRGVQNVATGTVGVSSGTVKFTLQKLV